MKSVSEAFEDATSTNPDWGFDPIFESIWAWGTVLEDDVLNPSTMLEPNFPVAPLRSGEIAPMNV